MSDFNAEVSQALRDYMADHEVSQERAAGRLGRSQGYVSHRTSGKNALSLDIVEAVAVLTSTSPRELLAFLAGPSR